VNTPKLNRSARVRRSARAPLSSKRILAAAVLAALPLASHAADACCSDADAQSLNSFSFSARLGFNVSARFRNPGQISFNSNRTTPHGDKYNYDDGYVLTDSSGNQGDLTSYWGYDNSSRQISGNTILMHKTTSASGLSSPWMDADNPAFGGELVYRRQLGLLSKSHDIRWGLELAGNFLNTSVNDHRSYAGNVTQRTDAYPFTPGTTPPEATPGSPFQGSFGGGNFLIGATPESSTFSSAAATVSGSRKIDADMFGFRLGPYVEFPVATNLNLSLSGGFAGALVDVDASWNETVVVGSSQFPFAGHGHDNEFRLGAYLAANAEYRFSQDWSVVGGAQYQSLANYEGTISGRKVEMDLRNNIFVTLGVSYKF
jgi:hypothetical protein